MHFTNSDVTDEDFLNNYLDSSSNNYPLTLNSRIEIIVGLHPLDNQYLPNEVIAGWFGEEPENDHPIPLDDHHDENLSADANSELEVENLPRATPIPIPNPRPALHGPTPDSVECLETWSQEQDQPMPVIGDRNFYDLSNGGSAGRILPIMVRRVAEMRFKAGHPYIRLQK